MHRLAVVALTLLVVFASVLPTVLARDTNADRFKRGYPPLPPSRREVAKRGKPSPSSAPQKATGFLQLRDVSGAHFVGYVEDLPARLPRIGVVSQKVQGQQATFSGSDHTLTSTDPAYGTLGNDGTPLVFNELTRIPSGTGATIWNYNAGSGELTVVFETAGGGGTIPAKISWDVAGDDLELVTDWAAYEAGQTEPQNKLPVEVRLFLVA